jgi:hypothetical protein
MKLDDVEVLERKTVCQSYFRIDRYMLRHRLTAGNNRTLIPMNVIEFDGNPPSIVSIMTMLSPGSHEEHDD